MKPPSTCPSVPTTNTAPSSPPWSTTDSPCDSIRRFSIWDRQARRLPTTWTRCWLGRVSGGAHVPDGGRRAMSLRDYQLFDQDWQRRRFSVNPCITCLWQVNRRNSVPFETWMELDMQYIDKWSLWLDFKILAQTIPAVVKGSGAT